MNDEDSCKKLDQITQEMNTICDLVERENRLLTDEELKRIGELSLEARKQLKRLFENPLVV